MAALFLRNLTMFDRSGKQRPVHARVQRPLQIKHRPRLLVPLERRQRGIGATHRRRPQHLYTMICSSGWSAGQITWGKGGHRRVSHPHGSLDAAPPHPCRSESSVRDTSIPGGISRLASAKSDRLLARYLHSPRSAVRGTRPATPCTRHWAASRTTDRRVSVPPPRHEWSCSPGAVSTHRRSRR